MLTDEAFKDKLQEDDSVELSQWGSDGVDSSPEQSDSSPRKDETSDEEAAEFIRNITNSPRRRPVGPSRPKTTTRPLSGTKRSRSGVTVEDISEAEQDPIPLRVIAPAPKSTTVTIELPDNILDDCFDDEPTGAPPKKKARTAASKEQETQESEKLEQEAAKEAEEFREHQELLNDLRDELIIDGYLAVCAEIGQHINPNNKFYERLTEDERFRRAMKAYIAKNSHRIPDPEERPVPYLLGMTLIAFLGEEKRLGNSVISRGFDITSILRPPVGPINRAPPVQDTPMDEMVAEELVVCQPQLYFL
jgi:hypothetical protein